MELRLVANKKVVTPRQFFASLGQITVDQWEAQERHRIACGLCTYEEMRGSFRPFHQKVLEIE